MRNQPAPQVPFLAIYIHWHAKTPWASNHRTAGAIYRFPATELDGRASGQQLYAPAVQCLMGHGLPQPPFRARYSQLPTHSTSQWGSNCKRVHAPAYFLMPNRAQINAAPHIVHPAVSASLWLASRSSTAKQFASTKGTAKLPGPNVRRAQDPGSQLEADNGQQKGIQHTLNAASCKQAALEAQAA